MKIGRKALYNLLRIKWLENSSLDVEPWQIEDYRSMSTAELFDTLQLLHLSLDPQRFGFYAEQQDTPEDLSDYFTHDCTNVKMQDRVYLILFELWRRLLPQKPTLSVFCDELDHQIFLYDAQEVDNIKEIHDILATLQNILDENVDKGEKPEKIFETIVENCANDIESFLYDYIAEHIDYNDSSYAVELLDGFYEYVTDTIWFDLLRARLTAPHNLEESLSIVKSILRNSKNMEDLSLFLELLSFIGQYGSKKLFLELLHRSLQYIRHEDDFIDLLEICQQFSTYSDAIDQEHAIASIIKSRLCLSPHTPLQHDDPAIKTLLSLLQPAIPSHP